MKYIMLLKYRMGNFRPSYYKRLPNLGQTYWVIKNNNIQKRTWLSYPLDYLDYFTHILHKTKESVDMEYLLKFKNK